MQNRVDAQCHLGSHAAGEQAMDHRSVGQR